MLSQTIFARALILSAAALSVCAGTIGNLVSRQLSPPPNVPEQCQETCQPLFEPMCQAIECQCTDSNAQLLANCLSCVVSAGGSLQDAQEHMDNFVKICAEFDSPVTPITIGGP